MLKLDEGRERYASFRGRAKRLRWCHGLYYLLFLSARVESPHLDFRYGLLCTRRTPLESPCLVRRPRFLCEGQQGKPRPLENRCMAPETHLCT